MPPGHCATGVCPWVIDTPLQGGFLMHPDGRRDFSLLSSSSDTHLRTDFYCGAFAPRQGCQCLSLTRKFALLWLLPSLRTWFPHGFSPRLDTQVLPAHTALRLIVPMMVRTAAVRVPDAQARSATRGAR